jgi:3'-phosphoadenosine 5'-phosphosulfate sulfotransferase (PAPS reductase)/FAD synthetase
MNGPEHLEILEPLGADQGTFVARDTSSGSPHLVVVERVTRASPVPAARSELQRRGRALKALEHPKVVRVRDVFERDAMLYAASPYVTLLPGERVRREEVRFRTVGDMTCTGAVVSSARTLDAVIAEVAAARVTERGATRADDRFTEAAMEDRKREGYF